MQCNIPLVVNKISSFLIQTIYVAELSVRAFAEMQDVLEMFLEAANAELVE